MISCVHKMFPICHPAEGRSPVARSAFINCGFATCQTPPFGGVVKYFAFLVLAVFFFVHPAFAADKILDVQKIKTPAGIEFWLVQDKTVPVISMNFSFGGGIVYDPEDKPGVGRLVSILLDEGAGDMMSQEFQSALSDKAIDMQFTAGRDAFHGQLRTLKANKDIAFHLLGLALNNPRFDKEAVERLRGANIDEIRNDMSDPDWLVARTFNGMAFEGHPYAIPALGTLDSMTRITRQDLLDFVHAQFARNVLKVAIAGDITKEDAAKAVDSIFASLPAEAEKIDEGEAAFKYTGKTIMLPFDTSQTTVSIGEEGLKRSDKDWPAAMVLNSILGGNNFEARLTQELRKKRKLTDGVISTLTSMRYASLLQVDFSASNENVAEALQIIQQGWSEMASNGPTDAEVQNAKNYLTGALPLELTSTTGITETLGDLQRDGLDADYINQRNLAINAVTTADVKRVAARLLKPDNLMTVLIGQPQGITADIMLDYPPGMKVPQQK